MTQYGLGRALQFLGLLVLPFAIASELSNAVGLGKSCLSRREEPECSTWDMSCRHARRETECLFMWLSACATGKSISI
jgi:hypothetical protein